ncbi:HK97-gp10 family putative phage morphogenesis protein [Schinkia azotoformans]|uniref:HK97-gp10 family putative phage morphogenesis protein n=1 Tax=Schinkia azotoformans TaxID=1454 RepID=UPI002DBB622C|nr:HK97-gp10 family putative phage morphogenesis protein [Schinkia azotoformans]MEC1714760.1 HK97 gp10 family phage protein [Schinkia azotoformans]MEC1757484.1 HK97 gp10 family phage protein [Schinkia azotoformans]
MGNIFSFDLTGIDVMIAKLDRLEKEIDRKLDDALIKCAELVVEDARKLAPLDTGDLEAAINVGDIKRELQRRYIEVGVSPEVEDYAIRMHEDDYKPGVKTASKEGVKGFTPGRKYLENAIKANEKIIIQKLAEALQLG